MSDQRNHSPADGDSSTEFPPVLAFMIGFCSMAERRTVGKGEILENLNNVRKIALNARINDTYHIPAGVQRYPGSKPDRKLSVYGAAKDVQKDLGRKGIVVPF